MAVVGAMKTIQSRILISHFLQRHDEHALTAIPNITLLQPALTPVRVTAWLLPQSLQHHAFIDISDVSQKYGAVLEVDVQILVTGSLKYATVYETVLSNWCEQAAFYYYLWRILRHIFTAVVLNGFQDHVLKISEP